MHLATSLYLMNCFLVFLSSRFILPVAYNKVSLFFIFIQGVLTSPYVDLIIIIQESYSNALEQGLLASQLIITLDTHKVRDHTLSFIRYLSFYQGLITKPGFDRGKPLYKQTNNFFCRFIVGSNLKMKMYMYMNIEQTKGYNIRF